jgi:Flp pilus assembly protein TadD
MISATRKALELDPPSAEVHLLLAGIQQEQWQWVEAEAGYTRALELSPNKARAHAALAQCMVCQGRTQKAVAWAQRGRELDPLAVCGVGIRWILFHARRYGEAEHELRSTLAVRPDEALALWFLGIVLIANGQTDQAIPILEKVVPFPNATRPRWVYWSEPMPTPSAARMHFDASTN